MKNRKTANMDFFLEEAAPDPVDLYLMKGPGKKPHFHESWMEENSIPISAESGPEGYQTNSISTWMNSQSQLKDLQLLESIEENFINNLEEDLDTNIEFDQIVFGRTDEPLDKLEESEGSPDSKESSLS